MTQTRVIGKQKKLTDLPDGEVGDEFVHGLGRRFHLKLAVGFVPVGGNFGDQRVRANPFSGMDEGAYTHM